MESGHTQKLCKAKERFQNCWETKFSDVGKTSHGKNDVEPMGIDMEICLAFYNHARVILTRT